MVQKTKLTGLLATLLITTLISACSPTKDKDVETFKVGVIADESGFMSGHGQSTIFGTRLAADKLNSEGGVLGKKIELIVLDGQSDPSSTSVRARELLGRNKVSLLIGTGTSAATLAAIGPATESKVPFIYTLDGEIKTCSPGDPNKLNSFIFASGFTERMAVKPLLEFLVKQVGKPGSETDIYFIGGDYVYPRTTNGYAIEVAKGMGLNVVGNEYSDTSTSDYSPLIRKIQAASPDILIVTNPGASGVAFMKQSQQFSLGKNVLISGFATFDQEALDAMGEASEGVYVINRYSNTLENSENIQFVERFREKYPDYETLPGPTASSGSYGALLLAAAAAEKAGSVDASAIAKALPGISMQLPQGTVSVSPSNHIFKQHLYLMQIKNKVYEVVSETPQLDHPAFEGCSVQ